MIIVAYKSATAASIYTVLSQTSIITNEITPVKTIIIPIPAAMQSRLSCVAFGRRWERIVTSIKMINPSR
jgi:hypothetical protein